MAKKFRFRLESVLRLREWETERAQATLSATVGERLGVEESITERRNYRRELARVQQAGRLSVRDMESRWYHVRFVDTEIGQLERKRRELLEIESLQRSQLSDALKKQEVLKKLREKEHSRYREALLAEEGRQLDEIAQRKRGNGIHLQNGGH